jgi:hypothetical protein
MNGLVLILIHNFDSVLHFEDRWSTITMRTGSIFGNFMEHFLFFKVVVGWNFELA